jgi:hypothetical protein
MGDASDPEIFTTAIVDVLRGYPEDIVRRVTAPRDGLPGKLKWLPTVAEVRDACEQQMEPRRREAARAARQAPLDDVDRSGRKTLAELQEECRRRGGLIPGARRGSIVPQRMTEAEIEKAMAVIAEYAAKPCGAKASPELLANIQERL